MFEADNRLETVQKQKVTRHTTDIVFAIHTIDGTNLITRHSVKDGQIGLGVLTPLNEVKKIINGTSDKNPLKNKGVSLIPPSVLLDTDEHLVWQKPTFNQYMWFNVEGKVKRFKVNWPNLLFIVQKKGNGIHVFATAASSRATIDTVLYLPPLMNISNQGSLCQGGASFTGNVNTLAIKEIEDVLIDSKFTHLNYREKDDFAGKLSISKKQSPYYLNNNDNMVFWEQKQGSNAKLKACEMIRAGTLESVLGKFNKGAI